MKKSLVSLILIFFSLTIGILILETFAKYVLKLGHVVVYDASPITGYRAKPNQTVNRRGVTVAINNESLRADPLWSSTEFDKRILFLGDSVTYGGSYINNNELFSYQALKKSNYIAGNAGVNGWGVLNIHALVCELKYLPARTVITVLPEGDFYRGLNRIGGQPLWTRIPKFALEEMIYFGLYQLNLKMNGLLSYEGLTELEKILTVDIAAKKLKELDNYLKKMNIRHFIFISPSKSQALKKASKDDLIYHTLDKHKINALYILDHITNLENIDSLFYDEIHLSKKGHQVWGDTIKKELIKFDYDLGQNT